MKLATGGGSSKQRNGQNSRGKSLKTIQRRFHQFKVIALQVTGSNLFAQFDKTS
jgi:hypothetical protein